MDSSAKDEERTLAVPSWLSQYMLAGLLAGGGGAMGVLATSGDTAVLEVRLGALENAVTNYHTDVRAANASLREEIKEIERRIDALEKHIP